MFTIENFVLIAFLVGFAIAITHIVKERQFSNRVLDKYFIRNAESHRVAGLPVLNTELFMRIPQAFAEGNLGWHLNNSRKTFRAYDGFVVAIDDLGAAWIGKLTPSVALSLRTSEYRENKYYYVPTRGRKQRMAGDPVVIGDVTIDVYPYFLDERFTDTDDWAEWLKIEKVYRANYENEKYDWVFVFDWIYPNDLRVQPNAI